MNKLLSITVSRMLAAVLVVVLVYSPISPVLTYADDSVRDRGDRGADTTPPTIASHDDVSVQTTSDSAVAAYTSPPTSDDVDGTGVALCTPASGSTFAMGTTEVSCTASDAAGNVAAPVFFNVTVTQVQEPVVPPPATSTPPTSTTTPPTSGTTTPPTTGTSTPPTGGSGATTTPSTPEDPSTFSSSATTSAALDPSQSDTENTDFENIVSGDPPPSNDTRPVIDVSATTTEALAVDPLLMVATSTDGTGSKIGGTIFTGNATASTTVKNILNITRSNIDGPGVTNSSRITAAADNLGEVTTVNETNAFTGENGGLGGVGDASIRTGRAVSSAQVMNVVNTNFFNSEGLVLFLKPENGDGLDLRDADLSYFVDGGVGAAPPGLGCTILTCLNSATLQVLNKNEGIVHNDVEVRASTGRNSATSSRTGNVDIQTGDAYASAAVLNLVNTNFVNSKYLLASFDNFGSMQGDIVLPAAAFFNTYFKNGNTLPEMNSSSYIVNNTNDETFTGTTTANAITGGNLATTSAGGEGHGEIQTGQAHTSATSYTAANQTYVGGSSALFVFHVSGEWSGSVKGLPAGMSWRRTDYGIEVYSNGAVHSTMAAQGIYNSANFIASSTNKAIVETDVNVWAETGSNVANTEHGVGKIATGDAYATANVVNMVNTNVVNRNFMFAVFNITGDWSGDIDFGGHSPNLGVLASATGANPASPDSELIYHFTVKNNGDAAADNVVLSTAYDKRLMTFSRWNTDVNKSDTSTSTSFAIGSLPVGASRTIDVTTRLRVSLPSNSSTEVPLTASVTSSQHDQDDNDNTTTISVLVTSGSPTPPPPPPPPSGGGGGGGGGPPPPPPGTGGNTPPPSTGTGTPPANTNTGTPPATNNTSPPPSNSSQPSSNSGGGGESNGVFVGGNAVSTTWEPNPLITVTKTSSVSTTTAPAMVNYVVVVKNDKSGGSAFRGLLTDTLYSPKGAVMSNRSWDLETIVPGDEITLTYTVEYATSTLPGTYKNVARVTGKRNSALTSAPDMTPVEASKNIVFTSNGSVLGMSTSTPKFAASSIAVAPTSCVPLLTSFMRQGQSNDPTQVMKLQTFLNETQRARLPVSGFFGSLTTTAVKNFQLKYKSEILTPLGITRPTGHVYGSTQRTINRLNCGLPAVSASNPNPPAQVASATIATPAQAPQVAPAAAPAGSAPSSKSAPKPAAKKPAAPVPLAKTAGAPKQGTLLNTVGSLFKKLW